MTSYRPASAVKRIAEELIPKYHAHLDGIRIEYVFRDKAATSAGKAVWGKARKISGLNAYLAAPEHSEIADAGDDDFFVVEIAEDIWAILDPSQRRALVDHELCHISIEWDDDKDTMKLAIRSHDLEEFSAVVQRHGLWRPEVEQFVATVDQLQLEFEGPLERGDKVTLNGQPVDPALNVLKDGAGHLRAVTD